MSREIRLADPRDAAQLAAIYAPSVTGTAASFELLAPDATEMARRVSVFSVYAPWLVLEEGAEILGYAYGSRHRERSAYQWSVDVTVYVRADQHRRGIGRALYEPLLELLRDQGFYAAHAGITLPNAASVGLHEALGFRPVGIFPGVGYKDGAWHDVGWWQLELRPRPNQPAPAPPAPFDPARAQVLLK